MRECSQKIRKVTYVRHATLKSHQPLCFELLHDLAQCTPTFAEHLQHVATCWTLPCLFLQMLLVRLDITFPFGDRLFVLGFWALCAYKFLKTARDWETERLSFCHTPKSPWQPGQSSGSRGWPSSKPALIQPNSFKQVLHTFRACRQELQWWECTKHICIHL
jgi:hypothetical protein